MTTEAQVKENDPAVLEAQIAEGKALLKELVDAGVHLGHKASDWNPKMQDFIYAKKGEIHIIDLSKTVVRMMDTANFLKKQARMGRNILFVGTSKQSSEIVKEQALKAGVFYINQRWLGGLITNFETIRMRLNKLRELKNQRDTGGFEGLGKKEISSINREIARLEKFLGGLEKMRGRPEVIVIVDQNKDAIAVQESQKVGVNLVTLSDTDCNPEDAGFTIPANNDSRRSIETIMQYFTKAILEGQTGAKKKMAV